MSFSLNSSLFASFHYKVVYFVLSSSKNMMSELLKAAKSIRPLLNCMLMQTREIVIGHASDYFLWFCSQNSFLNIENP